MKSGAREEADARKDEVRVLGERLKSLEDESRTLETSFRDTMLTIPNIVSDKVPDGEDETGNVVVREEGEKRSYDFELKPHWELSESLGVTDFERGAKLSGRMFYALGEAGARCCSARSCKWMLDLHRERHGYEERGVPFLVLGQTLVNSSNLPKFADALYHDAEEDLWLIPTAEGAAHQPARRRDSRSGRAPHQVHGAHALLPARARRRGVAGCAASSASTSSRRSRCTSSSSPEQSPAALDELVEHASDIVRGLRPAVPHPATVQRRHRLRVDAELRRGDMDARQRGVAGGQLLLQLHGLPRRGAPTSATGRSTARARTSCTRSTAPASHCPRVLIALLETYQQPDGSVRLPDVLVPYMGGQQTLDPL